jgi:hypothetical protein
VQAKFSVRRGRGFWARLTVTPQLQVPQVKESSRN